MLISMSCGRYLVTWNIALSGRPPSSTSAAWSGYTRRMDSFQMGEELVFVH